MTADERINAVEDLGFTERQARFLDRVMMFGGLCVPRQYATFSGTSYGQWVNAFFAKLVERGFAAKCRCIHNRASLYHVHHRTLYEAIGEGRSRFRRPVPVARVKERVMRLDSVLLYAGIRWLATETEKIEFLRTVVPHFPAERLPHLTGGCRVRLFPDDVAVGIDETRSPHLLHLMTTPFDDDFRAVLQRYGDLLGALPRWTFCLLGPAAMAPLLGRFQVTFRDELSAPLSATTIDELRWYFEQLRLAGGSARRLAPAPRFRRAETVFAASRFRVLYRRWLTDGEHAFDVVSSHRIIAHLGDETGRVETRVLPFSYDHLSPLVSRSHIPVKRVEEGAVRGATWSARSQPSRADEPVQIGEGLSHDRNAVCESQNAQKTPGLTS